MREADAHEQAAALLARDPAALNDPWAAARLLDRLREVGAHEQAAALAGRAAHAALDNPGGVALLLGSSSSRKLSRISSVSGGKPTAPPLRHG